MEGVVGGIVTADVTGMVRVGVGAVVGDGGVERVVTVDIVGVGAHVGSATFARAYT